ncbi:MAG: dTMP kinase [Burkholderiales bacterium]|nr:dTMP kinase [Burkholderiales bacterium]
MARGKFITFEGLDGAGKSSHIEAAQRHLAARGLEVISTREPGGTPLGEALRELLLHQPMHLDTETLLMFAARREHLAKVIEPALARGAWVICDRFTDATRAYQGGGRGVSLERIEALAHWVHPGLEPDLTLVFDLDPEIARRRLAQDRAPDRFEREELEFHRRVRDVYLGLEQIAGRRVVIIDAGQGRDDVEKMVYKNISTL